MESSRIFVRGLPPTLKSEEFKDYFSKISPITDAKLFAHRRIGYVGYKSHDEARKAVKYFNRSYIRMSRIEVELAKPVVPLSTRPAVDQEQRAVSLTPESKGTLTKQKRKRDITDREDDLVLMPSNTKANATSELLGVNQESAETQDASKRLKKPLEVSSHDLDTELDTPDSGAGLEKDMTSNDKPIAIAENQVMVEANAPDGLENPPASDADWLRSRTSRLLGLLNDDEIQEPSSHIGVDKGRDPSDHEDSESPEPSKGSRADNQLDHEVSQNASIQPEITASEDIVPAYSRIFIRNLAYDVAESDLREHFATYGSLEEVSIKDISFLLLYAGFNPRMMNIQIGTSYASLSVASGVTWITVF